MKNILIISISILYTHFPSLFEIHKSKLTTSVDQQSQNDVFSVFSDSHCSLLLCHQCFFPFCTIYHYLHRHKMNQTLSQRKFWRVATPLISEWLEFVPHSKKVADSVFKGLFMSGGVLHRCCGVLHQPKTCTRS